MTFWKTKDLVDAHAEGRALPDEGLRQLLRWHHSQFPQWIAPYLSPQVLKEASPETIADITEMFEHFNSFRKRLSLDPLPHMSPAAPGEAPTVWDQLQQHPHFRPVTEEQRGIWDVGRFWHEYEKTVTPEHFATIIHHLRNPEQQDMFSPKWAQTHYNHKDPVVVQDHRGRNGSSEQYAHLLPHFDNYARAVQGTLLNSIQKDRTDYDRQGNCFYHEGKQWVPSGYSAPEPCVLLYRGVAGEYAQKILEAHKTGRPLTVQTTPAASWSSSSRVARNFAERKIPGHPLDGVVLARWTPISQIMHSGWHYIHLTQEHAHPDEREFVVKHPTGTFTMPHNQAIHLVIKGDSEVVNKLNPVKSRPPTKAYLKKDDKYFYHVTSRESAAKIKDEGLKPDSLGRVYLWDNERSADWFRRLHESDDKKMTTLVVSVDPKLLTKDPETEDMSQWGSAWKEGEDGGGHIHHGAIHPHNIRHMETFKADLKETEPVEKKAASMHHNTVLPPGSLKEGGPTGTANRHEIGKRKVKHGSGKEGWVQARSGQIQASNDRHAPPLVGASPHPISSRNPKGH